MSKELIIRSNSDAVDFALTTDGKLIELHREEKNKNFVVGDIFLAKIRKTLPGLNASFVDVGYDKDGFLHYHDLGPQVSSLMKFLKGVISGKIKDYDLKNFSNEKDIHKDGVITDVLNPNQSVLVQIVKEPISTKGPRLSSELSLPGRYVVLVPFSDRISISQKIEDGEEKDRLKRLVRSIKPKGFGVIIRTVAEGKKVADLDQDIQKLISRWRGMCKKLPQAGYPSRVLGELNWASSFMRDIFNDSFTSICTDDEELYEQIRDRVASTLPEKESIVKLHKKNVPIFEKFGIERQIKTAFGKTVSMPKGAYLVIDHTEAMHVIDVNSGNRSNKTKNQEDTALEVNLISATEVARQLRLRDMGGIIVIDFIDMKKAENRKALYNHLVEAMKEDTAKHKILPPTKFGLIQITRQRVRPALRIKTREENPNAKGEEIEAPIVIVDKIKADLQKLLQKDHKNLSISAHPFIAAYLTKGFPSPRSKWFFDYKRWVKILPRDAYTYLEYHFHDKDGKIIS